MRQKQKSQSHSNTSVSFPDKDEQKQIAHLEQEWQDRQMYFQDNWGYYA